MNLRINPFVTTDLKSIRDYIAEDNIDVARDTISGIYTCFENLQNFPSMGADLSKRVSFKTNYKYFAHGNYIIIYLVGKDYIEIYRVLGRFQDITRALF